MDEYKNEIQDYLKKSQIPEEEKAKLEAFLDDCNHKLRMAIKDKIVDVIDAIEEEVDIDVTGMNTYDFADEVTDSIFTYYYRN